MMLRKSFGALLVLLGCCLVFCGSVFGAVPTANWSFDSFAAPSVFSTGDNTGCEHDSPASKVEPLCDSYDVAVTDTGSRPTVEGSPVVLADALPAGLTVQRIEFFWSGFVRLGGAPGTNLAPFFCSAPPEAPRCELPFQIEPDDRLQMVVYVTVGAGTPETLTNTMTVSGGGLPEASGRTQKRNGGPSASFGLSSFNALTAGADGLPDTQAGGHPDEGTQAF